MNEATDPRGRSSEQGLKAVHTQWALGVTRKLRLLYPELPFTLYGSDWTFTIHVSNCEPDAFPVMLREFERNIRPATCHIVLSQQAPQAGAPIKEVSDYGAELWLKGEPLSVRDFNNLLSIAEPNLPAGGIDFDNSRDSWVFRSFTSLTDVEMACVERAAKKVGVMGPLECVRLSPPTASAPPPGPISKRQGDLTIATSRQIAPGPLRDLLHEDEDEWRAFLARRAAREIVMPEPPGSSNFACLYDVEHCGDSRLSEMPAPRSFAWSAKHQVSVSDLQELVRQQ
jgi:hypothetical protein